VLALVCLLVTHVASGTPSVLCENDEGVFLGLVSDEVHRHRQRMGDASITEDWIMVEEIGSKYENGVEEEGIKNSFTGKYAQDLPDDGDSYNAIYAGSDLDSLPSLAFRFQAGRSGIHTLALRWTGGDTGGGGDSLYVAMHESADEESDDWQSFSLKPGMNTWKPAVAAIEDTDFEGACYSMTTHATPCYMNSTRPADCDYWLDLSSSINIGVSCVIGDGTSTLVEDPQWYEFAGQVYGNVMDFDSEPWDSSCESMATGTADTGLDNAQWDLTAGVMYDLAFYPREDGTAIDAVYLAGPDSEPPAYGFRLKSGDSTVCETEMVDKKSDKEATSMNAGAIAGITCGVLLVIAIGIGIGVWKFKPKIFQPKKRFINLDEDQSMAMA